MSEEKVNTYSTKVEQQQTLEIPKGDDSWDDVLDENGVIPTTLNVPVMVQRLATDIYKNATSGIRELYMNAVRGCIDGVKLFGYTDPHITVTINEPERIITIEDNGRGITKARFKQVLRELGTSDNHDGKTTGQFGMGFASYMTLASVCVLDTIGNNGDNYKMVCRDGISSKPAGKADMESHGVKLTLTCYESVDLDEVCKKLYDTACHASVPTTVILEDFEYTPDSFEDGVNEIEQVKFDENIPDDIKENMIIIDTEDFTLLASDDMSYAGGRHIYLLNVPIDSEIEVPFHYYTINIKDERKFQPMPDRDRMREKSDDALQTKITDTLNNHFKDMNILTYNEYINSPRRQEFIWLMGNPSYAPEHMQARVQQLSNCDSHLREVVYGEKNQPSPHSLSYWLRTVGVGGITYQGHKSKPHTEKVKQYLNPDCTILTCKKSVNDNWQDTVEVLNSFGVPTVKQILKDNKVKIVRPASENVDGRTIVGHVHMISYETQDYIYEDIDSSFVRTDLLKMNDMMSLVRRYPTNMTFLRNEPSLKETECQSLSGWLDNFKHVEIRTNKGLIVAETLAMQGNLHYCYDIEPGYDKMFEELDETFVLDNHQVLGMALLKYFGNSIKNRLEYSSLLEVEYLDTLFTKRYGVSIYNDKTQKYVIEHLHEIEPVYHELFARVCKKCNNNFADNVALNEMNRYLALIKEYGELDGADEIEKLKFYHAKWQTLPNKQAGITRIFDELVDKSKEIIHDNQYLLNKFVQEEALVKLFKVVEVRKCKINAEIYDVSFTTNQHYINFKEEFKVYGFKIKVTDINVRIYKNYSLIGAKVEVTC